MHATGEMEFWPELVLAVLATWRITHLLACEDGPGHLIARLRERLGSSLAGALMDCFYCLSLWVAAPIALWITARPLDWFMTWIALSGAACLCERTGPAGALVQPIIEGTKGDEDGMLRTETQRTADRLPIVAEPRAESQGPTRH